MWTRSNPLSALAASLGVALALVAAPGSARATPGASKVMVHAKPSKKGPQSIGAPNSGHLVGAARLKGSRYLKQREGNHSWGLPELVRLLTRASAAVARKHPRSVMLVGDLSGRTGGHLDGHGSHQTGRDADVGFYVMNSKGKPLPTKRFIAFDGAGNARDVPGARFDDARNWTLVEALLKDEKAGVRYLFITNELRARLLAQAKKKHAPKELVDRAAAAMMSPPEADQHDDHFHVRITCPEPMRGACVEEAVARTASEDRPEEPKAP
jgi:penicillin-insensitive murein endopeptidase